VTFGDIECKVDGSWHPSLETLHKHLRKLKVRQEDYYTTHERRVCRYNGTPIPFKNWSDYLATDFSSKDAMRYWMVANPAEGRVYAVELIARRMREKGLTRVPCEVELKSLGFPRVRYYESIGGLNAAGNRLGLESRFDYGAQPPEVADITGDVIIDTREQLPLTFPRSVRAKLQFGDYALAANESVAVERKSIQDLIGTLITGYDRFTREIQRVEEVGGYLVVACEVDINTALSFDDLPEIARHTNLKPQVVFHNIRDLLQQFPCVQFLFCNGVWH